MKVLLDENLPLVLKKTLGAEHEYLTVHEMGWLNRTNGDLLRAMEREGFDFLLTADKNLRYQQALDKFRVRFIVLRPRSLDVDNLIPLLPGVAAYLASGEFVKVFEIHP